MHNRPGEQPADGAPTLTPIPILTPPGACRGLAYESVGLQDSWVKSMGVKPGHPPPYLDNHTSCNEEFNAFAEFCRGYDQSLFGNM